MGGGKLMLIHMFQEIEQDELLQFDGGCVVPGLGFYVGFVVGYAIGKAVTE